MKKFLSVFAGVAAAFAGHANASAVSSTSPSIVDSTHVSSQGSAPLAENIAIVDDKGDQFNFILKKSDDTGLMMAYHSSHSSHSSHRSHSSHYSSR
jgi:hypothetical protein